MAASISHFVTAATKFSCCSSDKKLSLSGFRSLSPFFSLSFAGLPPTFSFSRSFSCSIFWSGGRAVGRCTVTWLPNFLGWVVVYHIFLPMVLRCARFARESSAIKNAFYSINHPDNQDERTFWYHWFKSYLTNSNALSTVSCHLKKIITCGVPPAINPRGTFGYIMHQRFAWQSKINNSMNVCWW